MGKLLFIVLLVSVTSLHAQSFMPGSFIDPMYRGNFLNAVHTQDTATNKSKWFVNRYSSISTSFSVFKGGSAMVVSAPIGLQLNRKLNNNLYAFAGLSVAPAYVSFNNSFLNSNFNKGNQNNGFYKPNGIGVYSRAELGLQYVNDERTFSISGSIGIERNSYPNYAPINNTRTNSIINAIR